MKIRTDDLILGQAERNNPILLTLCKNWQKGANTESDPVSGVRELYNFRIKAWALILVVEVLIISVNFSSLIKYEGPLNHSDSAVFVVACLATTVFIFVLWFYKILSKPKRQEIFLDAIHFINSIERVEKLVQFPFTSWHLGDVEHSINGKLIDIARRIDWLRNIPWQARRAEAEFEDWKKLHASMRRLFPGLSCVYQDYFPKHEKVVLAEVTQK